MSNIYQNQIIIYKLEGKLMEMKSVKKKNKNQLQMMKHIGQNLKRTIQK